MQAIDLVMSTISFPGAGIGSSLFHDYLEGKFSVSPADTGQLLEKARKREFTGDARHRLVETLTEYYRQQGIGSGDSFENIRSLSGENVFTITTGHQPCLATGPAYFIYKIVSVIAMCHHLNAMQQEYRFVPVYWMNGEDHDFAEINHFWFREKKFEWNIHPFPESATGRLSTSFIPAVFEELSHAFDHLGLTGEEWAIIEKIYSDAKTLGEATFRLVHHWFGKYGLVIFDQDQPLLKESIIPVFEKELMEQVSYQALSRSNAQLESAGYSLQIQPREINLFYHAPEGRKRIVHENDRYAVLDTSLIFTSDEIRKKLQASPGNFSTNVVTRPLYQETVLPNIAYVGGPAEVHYWLQLPSVFEAFGVSFPTIVMRDSFLLMTRKWRQKMEKTGLEYADFFLPLHEIEKLYISRQAGAESHLLVQRITGDIENIYRELEIAATAADGSLGPAVKAEQQKTLNGLKNLESRIIKGLKNREELHIRTIHDIRERIFPGGTFQERREHILNFTAQPEHLIERLLAYANPLQPVVKILEID